MACLKNCNIIFLIKHLDKISSYLVGVVCFTSKGPQLLSISWLWHMTNISFIAVTTAESFYSNYGSFCVQNLICGEFDCTSACQLELRYNILWTESDVNSNLTWIIILQISLYCISNTCLWPALPSLIINIRPPVLFGLVAFWYKESRPLHSKLYCVWEILLYFSIICSVQGLVEPCYWSFSYKTVSRDFSCKTLDIAVNNTIAETYICTCCWVLKF